MSQIYYTLEQTAEILKVPPGEVNRMREQNVIRAFRDGSNWKFRKEDVDKTLADLIKKKNQEEATEEVEEDDILTLGFGADDDDLPTLIADPTAVSSVIDSAVDVVVEPVEDIVEVAHEAVVDAAQNVTDDIKSTISFEKKTEKEEDDGLSLADDDVDDDNLHIGLTEDSDLHHLPGGAGLQLESDEHDEDEELVLGGGSDLDLTGGSGLTLANDDEESIGLVGDNELELDEDSDILALADSEEDSTGIDFSKDSSAAVQDEPQDEEESFDPAFELVSEDEDEPDSSSQVIALDDASDTFSQDSFDEFDDFGPVPTTESSIQLGQDDPLIGGSAPTPTTTSATSPYQATYSGKAVVALGIACLLLGLSGMMLYDLVRNMWSWGQPFVLTSPIMETIAGIAGLK